MDFLSKIHHSLLTFRNNAQHYSTVFESHFEQQNHQQKAQECDTKYTEEKKGILFFLQQKGWNKKAEHHFGQPYLELE